MFSHPQQGVDREEVVKSRQAAGRYIKALREAAGYSQRELAVKVGLDYYTFISQIEAGKGRVPPHQMPAWARALKVGNAEFATALLKFYDPISYGMIFEKAPPQAAVEPAIPSDVLARLARLEEILAGK